MTYATSIIIQAFEAMTLPMRSVTKFPSQGVDRIREKSSAEQN